MTINTAGNKTVIEFDGFKYHRPLFNSIQVQQLQLEQSNLEALFNANDRSGVRDLMRSISLGTYEGTV